MVDAFLIASREGSFETLLTVLDPKVVLRYDRVAADQNVPGEAHGAQAVARLFVGRARETQSALINGSVGIIVAPRGRLLLVLEVAIVNGRIAEINAISDPARLRKLDLAVLDY